VKQLVFGSSLDRLDLRLTLALKRVLIRTFLNE